MAGRRAHGPLDECERGPECLLSPHTIALFLFWEYYHSTWTSKPAKGAATNGNQELTDPSGAQAASLSIGIQRKPGLAESI